MNKYAPGVKLTNAANALINAAGRQGVVIINGRQTPLNSNLLAGKPVVIEPDAQLRQSILGTPILTDLTLSNYSYFDPYANKIITGAKDICLDTVLITVSQSIKVIKTEIQGAPIGTGTVKEYIGMSDAQIVINGIITGKNGVYPRTDVNLLKAWLDAPVTKGLVSWWLQNLGIHYVVIDSYSIPQVEGGYSQQIFSIQASSDAPVSLRNISTPVQTAS